MHLTMSYRPTIDFHHHGAAAGGPPGAPPRPRQQQPFLSSSRNPKRQQIRVSSKSSPCDPDDLRRRLHVVIAQQNAVHEKQERAKRDAEAKKAREQKATLKQQQKQQAAEVKSHNNSSSAAARTAAAAERTSSSQKRKQKKAPLPRPFSGPYVPQEAASQFEKTTTSDLMVDTSDNALKRSLSHRDYDEGGAVAAGQAKNRFARTTNNGRARPTSMADILEISHRTTALDMRHHHLLDEESSPDGPNHIPVGQEPRVDWTQSDEINNDDDNNNKRKSSTLTLRSPLLRKAESIWTLKGKLGTLHHHHHHNHGKSNRAMERTISEETSSEDHDPEEGEASAEASPVSPRTRLGFLSKLKR